MVRKRVPGDPQDQQTTLNCQVRAWDLARAAQNRQAARARRVIFLLIEVQERKARALREEWRGRREE